MRKVRICEFLWAISYHRLCVSWLLLVGSWNLKAPPYVILELPDIHTLRTLGIVDELRSNSSCLALGPRKQVLFPWISSTSQITIKAVVKARAVVVIVVEELSVERPAA